MDHTEQQIAVHSSMDGAVLTLVMAYERRRNALAPALKAALVAGLETGMADPACRAIVLTGAGGHFCAGGDISGMSDAGGMSGRARMGKTQHLIQLLVNGDTPVIAAVEGHAAGAGLSLAAACDIVVASSQAIFTCSFNKIGLVPDLGAAWTLPRRMGLGRAKMLMLRGKPLNADEAERQGIVDVLAPPGEALAAAQTLAAEIAERSPLSNTMAKALLGRSTGSLEDLLRAEADAQGLLYATDDFAEGRAAFAAKRPPLFAGH